MKFVYIVYGEYIAYSIPSWYIASCWNTEEQAKEEIEKLEKVAKLNNLKNLKYSYHQYSINGM